MARYGMLVPAYTGHLNPMLVLGRALAKRGHEITFISPLDSQTKVEKAGFTFCPIAATEFPLGEWEQTTAGLGKLTGLKASRYVGRWLERFLRGIFRDLPEILARERWDGLVMDQVVIGVDSVCAVAQQPLAVACNALMLHAEPDIPPWNCCWPWRSAWPFRFRNFLGYALLNSTGWPVIREITRFRRKHKLPWMRLDHMNELPPSLVQVAQQPAFFDFPRRRLPDHFHYTGPWVEQDIRESTGFPWERLDGRPLIYASLGTLQNRLDHIFRIIAEACAGLDAQLVIGLGRKDAAPFDGLPGNPIVVGYAPQLALLKRASLVITHGGLNTTLECLAEGLPLVVLPIANDQPGVAARVKYLGLGEFIPLKNLTPSNLRHAVNSALNSRSLRERAQECAKVIRQANGPSQAAQLIETAFVTRKRVVQT